MSIGTETPRSAAEKRELLARLLAERASRAGQHPLSFGQQRLWFLDQLQPGSPAYNISMGMRLPVPPPVAVLEAALREIARRHEVLRTTFAVADGEPVQVIAPAAHPALAQVDLLGLPEALRPGAARRASDQLTQSPFDLARGPLFQIALLRLGAANHLVLLVMHHIISDGWSAGVLIRELIALTEALAAGRPSPCRSSRSSTRTSPTGSGSGCAERSWTSSSPTGDGSSRRVPSSST